MGLWEGVGVYVFRSHLTSSGHFVALGSGSGHLDLLSHAETWYSLQLRR